MGNGAEKGKNQAPPEGGGEEGKPTIQSEIGRTAKPPVCFPSRPSTPISAAPSLPVNRTWGFHGLVFLLLGLLSNQMQVVGARVKPSYPHSRSVIPAERRRAFPAPASRQGTESPSLLRLLLQSLPTCMAMGARAVMGSRVAWPRCQAAQPNPVRNIKTGCIRKSLPSWPACGWCVCTRTRMCVLILSRLTSKMLLSGRGGSPI